MWSDLAAAFALMMVIEGILPFLSPGHTRQTLFRLMNMNDRSLRMVGLASMLFGLLLLYLAR